MTTVVLDLMGGDHAPSSAIEAIHLLAKEKGLKLIIIGLQKIIDELDLSLYSNISSVYAEDVIEMDDSPALAFKTKKKSSVHIGLNLVKEGKADAFVSAGNTGAVMAASMLILGRIPGVDRPAICTWFPTVSGRAMVLDLGSTVDAKAQNLLQFAIMGHHYAKISLNIDNPRVGLLNIGEEVEKGNQLTQATFPLLKDSKLNFVGNVEGKDIFSEADVVVCDGFLGNVVLKFGEGLMGFVFDKLKAEINQSWLRKLAAWILKPAFYTLKKLTDYEEYGGAPLLGIKGVSIIAHGKSNSKALKNAVLAAKKLVEQDLVSKIEKAMVS